MQKSAKSTPRVLCLVWKRIEADVGRRIIVHFTCLVGKFRRGDRWMARVAEFAASLTATPRPPAYSLKDDGWCEVALINMREGVGHACPSGVTSAALIKQLKRIFWRPSRRLLKFTSKSCSKYRPRLPRAVNDGCAHKLWLSSHSLPSAELGNINLIHALTIPIGGAAPPLLARSLQT